MGNSLGGKKTTKVMKIDGQTMKYKTPVYANEVLKDYPTMVLLESEAVKHFGIRAKPLEPQQELKSKRLYFLVELPKSPEEKTPRRVRSGIQMSAKDRLETLMLARRSVSDLSLMKPASIMREEPSYRTASGPLINPLSHKTDNGGAVRLKLRLPKAEVEKLMMQSKDEADAAEKIMQLCMANNGGGGAGADMFQTKSGPLLEQQNYWKNNGGIIKGGIRSREPLHFGGGKAAYIAPSPDPISVGYHWKRVGFLPITEGEIQVAVASY